MEFDDFVQQFNKLYICRLFSEDFNQYVIKGEWVGKTAAGGHRVMVDRNGEKEVLPLL